MPRRGGLDAQLMGPAGLGPEPQPGEPGAVQSAAASKRTRVMASREPERIAVRPLARRRPRRPRVSQSVQVFVAVHPTGRPVPRSRTRRSPSIP